MIKRTVARCGGTSIAYRDFGSLGSPTVVLCHGICASGRQFESDARHFAEMGYRVLVPDLPGHGTSSPLSTESEDPSIDGMAADLEVMFDHAGVANVHWLGNSLGGIAGLGLMRRNPDRLLSFASFGTVYRLSLPLVAPRLLPMLYKLFGRKALSRMTAAATTADPTGRQVITEMIATHDPTSGERIARAVRAYDLRAVAQAFPRPILLMHGSKDRAVNLGLASTLDAMAKHQDFRRIDLLGSGHCANLDEPEVVRSVLDAFWRRAGARPVCE